MRNQFIIFTFISIGLISCVSTKDRLQGSWIETYNLINPQIVQFEDIYLNLKNINSNYRKLYHVKKDTLYTEANDEIFKSRIKWTKSGFDHCYFNNDSLKTSFEKNKYLNFIEYFNKKLNVLIDLPRINADKIELINNNNIIFAESHNNKLNIIFNGEKHFLTETSYLKIIPNEDERINLITNFLYIDKKMKLSDFYRIKSELQKADLLRVAYVVLGNNNDLKCIYLKLAQYEGFLPDSIINLLPPKAEIPQYESENFNKTNVLCNISRDYSILNSDTVSFELLKKLLKNNIKSFPEKIIHINFNKDLNYEEYLSYMYELRNIYYTVRKEALLEISIATKNDQKELKGEDSEDISNEIDDVDINDKDSLELNSDIEVVDIDTNNEEKIQKKYPMIIREIDEITYLKLRKYAL